ncbi:MAG: MoaD/ThiS family protein [Flavobacteriales bacterium]|nr:MoaD/ThiS family protein [Flavobacteriales bacterium]
MKLTINYFGMIAEAIGSSKAEFEFHGKRVSDLKQELENTFPELEGMSYQIAVNQKLVSTEIVIAEQDEIAVLPPFAGG